MVSGDDDYVRGYNAARRYYSHDPLARLAAIRRDAEQMRIAFAHRMPAPMADFFDRIDEKTRPCDTHDIPSSNWQLETHQPWK